MYFEEFGKGNDKTIVFLHGACIVHTFGMQYPLAEKYHLLVPHIMGYGNHTECDFDADKCIAELTEFIKGLNKKVLLVGFSMGGQLAFRLASEHEELFSGAIIGSAWIIKEEPLLSQIVEANLKNVKYFKKKWFCNLYAMVNGLPRKARPEFVKQTQNISVETMRKTVDNGITFETVPNFKNISIPMVAVAGAKEPPIVAECAKKMTEINPNCRYEIWEKTAHNAPLHQKRFNKLIEDIIEK